MSIPRFVIPYFPSVRFECYLFYYLVCGLGWITTDEEKRDVWGLEYVDGDEAVGMNDMCMAPAVLYGWTAATLALDIGNQDLNSWNE